VYYVWRGEDGMVSWGPERSPDQETELLLATEDRDAAWRLRAWQIHADPGAGVPLRHRSLEPGDSGGEKIPLSFAVREGELIQLSAHLLDGPVVGEQIGYLAWDRAATAINLYVVPLWRRRGAGSALWRVAAAYVAAVDGARLVPSYARTVLGELLFTHLQVPRQAWRYLALPTTEAADAAPADRAQLVPDDLDQARRLLAANGFDQAAAAWACAADFDTALPLHTPARVSRSRPRRAHRSADQAQQAAHLDQQSPGHGMR